MNLVKKSILGLAVAGISILGMAFEAKATLVTDNFYWDITFASPGNQFGLSDTDVVTGFATYDPGNIAGGMIFVNDYPGQELQVTFGNTTLTQADDDFGSPYLSFSNTGDLMDVSLWKNALGFTGIGYTVGTDAAEAWDNLEYMPIILASGFTVTAPADSAPSVPIPGAVWLFGSGVLGLLGLRRKG